ncbi:unnamed protein product [Penicillium olsonii]|nr:unnamed protein product [Penicillium olsonii]
MAAPLDINILNLNGNWVLNKELTTEAEPILKLVYHPFPKTQSSHLIYRHQQKIPWLIRKAFSFATIYIRIQQYPVKDSESSDPPIQIDFEQTASAGLAGTKEERILDWASYEHTDYFFGSVKGQSRFVHGTPGKDGSIRPEFELQTDTKSEQIKQFLRGEVNVDLTKAEGFLVEAQHEPCNISNPPGCWVHTFEKNEKLGWTVEQVSNRDASVESQLTSTRFGDLKT